MQLHRFFCVILIGFSLFFSNALSAKDLRPQYLKISISADDALLSKKEIKPIIVTFTNLDSRPHNVLLPGIKNTGNNLIYLRYFKVEGNFYREVFTENRALQLDTTYKGYIDLQELEAGASISFPLFINDSVNYSSHIQAHHKIPNLENGEYQLLLCYNPWDEELANYFYQKNDFGFDRDFIPDTTKLEIDASGICSNYMKIILSDSTFSNRKTNEEDKLCGLISAEKWKAVEDYLKRETVENDQFKNDWLECECVFWAYPMPSAMLASLPSYNGRFLILRANGKFHYAYANWQFGEVYKARMRMNQFGYLLRIRKPLISSSDHTKLFLLKFTLY